MNNKINKYIALATSIFIIDRITKIAALNCCFDIPRHITSFLSFEVTLNRGISWGMLHSTNDIVFIIVSLVITMITALFGWFAYYNYKQGKNIIAEVSIIAASLSNLVDRAVYGGVIDFILLSYGSLYWPVFNIADVMIVLGVCWLLWKHEK